MKAKFDDIEEGDSVFFERGSFSIEWDKRWHEVTETRYKYDQDTGEPYKIIKADGCWFDSRTGFEIKPNMSCNRIASMKKRTPIGKIIKNGGNKKDSMVTRPNLSTAPYDVLVKHYATWLKTASDKEIEEVEKEIKNMLFSWKDELRERLKGLGLSDLSTDVIMTNIRKLKMEIGVENEIRILRKGYNG